jgi:hypothetical protein
MVLPEWREIWGWTIHRRPVVRPTCRSSSPRAIRAGNSPGYAAPERLASIPGADVAIGSETLVRLHRLRRSYTWDVVSSILGSEPRQRTA